MARFDPKTCGELMQKWEKFTAIGAIGPDLFFFSQDWNNEILGPISDDIMLASPGGANRLIPPRLALRPTRPAWWL